MKAFQKEKFTHIKPSAMICVGTSFLEETGIRKKAGSKQLVYYEAGDIYQKIRANHTDTIVGS